jgi:hypothetical protein
LQYTRNFNIEGEGQDADNANLTRAKSPGNYLFLLGENLNFFIQILPIQIRNDLSKK